MGIYIFQSIMPFSTHNYFQNSNIKRNYRQQQFQHYSEDFKFTRRFNYQSKLWHSWRENIYCLDKHYVFWVFFYIHFVQISTFTMFLWGDGELPYSNSIFAICARPHLIGDSLISTCNISSIRGARRLAVSAEVSI